MSMSQAMGEGVGRWSGDRPSLAYELLQRDGDGWTALPGEPPPSFPQSIAPGLFLVGGNGRAWAIRRK